MEKRKRFIKLCAIMVVWVLFLGVSMKSEAATIGTASGLKQTGAGTNRVDISWDAVIGNQIQYKMELCANKKFVSGVKDNLGANNMGSTAPNGSFYGLTAGKKYYVRVTPFTNSGYPDYQCTWGTPSKVLEGVTAPIGNKIQNLRQTSATETSVTLSWKKYSGANAYQLTYGKKGSGNNGKRTINLGNVKSCTIKKLSKNTKYDFKICPVNKSASGYQALSNFNTAISDCPVLPTKVKEVRAFLWSPTSNYLEIHWKKSECADGYKYQIYTENGKKALISGKKSGDSDNTYFSSEKLKGNRFLKLRVQGLVEINGSVKTGTWSDWTYFSRQPDVELKSTKSGMKVTWDKVDGADNYTVYVSNKRKSGYTKVASTTKTSMVVKKCGSSNLKSGKQYYFMVAANKKIGKKTFQSTRNYCFWQTYRK
ncbi:MAG: fibronectin type III domain-containing protein [Lachnospiraceae bacterium]|nr:fibronectin type III domain-containing protein [Lachnospiraceae bacterium]